MHGVQGYSIACANRRAKARVKKARRMRVASGDGGVTSYPWMRGHWEGWVLERCGNGAQAMPLNLHERGGVERRAELERMKSRGRRRGAGGGDVRTRPPYPDPVLDSLGMCSRQWRPGRHMM